LEYGINFDIYTSSYDLYGGSGSVRGDVSWVAANNYSFSNTTPFQSIHETRGGVTVEEKTRLQHTIIPSLTYSTDLGERVKLGLKLNLPFTVGSSTSKGRYTKTWSTRIQTPTGGPTTTTENTRISYAVGAGEFETSLFKVDPALSIGVQIAAVLEKLTLNLGLTNKISYSSEKTLTKPTGVGYQTNKVTVGDLVTTDTKTSDPIGTKTDTSTVNKSWSDLDAKISAGFSFFFGPNFFIDTNYTSSALGAGQNAPSGISFIETSFWDDVINGSFAVMFTIKK
jgi:hypothetical protein